MMPIRIRKAAAARRGSLRILASLGFAALFASAAAGQTIAVRGKTVYTMAGPPIPDGVVFVRDGKIAAVGKAAEATIPDGTKTVEAEFVLPGLIDAHSVVGLSGIYNQPHDSDQLESSGPVQPELRAIDAYNPNEPLIAWVRSFGVTTLHTGHAPGELLSGQTMIVKTTGNTVAEALMVESATLAVTLGPSSEKAGKSPGTRGKQIAMLREEFIKAQEYQKKLAAATQPEKRPDRSLHEEALARVLAGELPLMVTAQRAQDIAGALRLAEEFKLHIWLDGAAESYLLIDDIRKAGVPVLIHPTMWRAWGETENLSYETAARLRKAGIPVALQSGYEDYVPKTRVVLFEAAVAAANGLSREEAISTITIDAARILGIDKRVGSLEPGKDGDLALYDGDPLEYTTHCLGTVIEGKVVSSQKR